MRYSPPRTVFPHILLFLGSFKGAEMARAAKTNILKACLLLPLQANAPYTQRATLLEPYESESFRTVTAARLSAGQLGAGAANITGRDRRIKG